jgi:DNA-binding protein HU-beta
MSKLMPKDELMTQIALTAGVTKAQAAAVLDAAAETVRLGAARGLTVALPGLGRFAVKVRAARVGRNPATGVPIDVPEKVTLGFLTRT